MSKPDTPLFTPKNHDLFWAQNGGWRTHIVNAHKLPHASSSSSSYTHSSILRASCPPPKKYRRKNEASSYRLSKRLKLKKYLILFEILTPFRILTIAKMYQDMNILSLHLLVLVFLLFCCAHSDLMNWPLAFHLLVAFERKCLLSARFGSVASPNSAKDETRWGCWMLLRKMTGETDVNHEMVKKKKKKKPKCKGGH